MVLIYDIDIFECSRAAKSDHDIVLYDSNDEVIRHISNIYDNEWNYISLYGGDWEELIIEPELSLEEKIQMKLDQLQADMDYCLMLLDEN